MITPEQKLEHQIEAATQEYLQSIQQRVMAAVQRAFTYAGASKRPGTRNQPKTEMRQRAKMRDREYIQALTTKLEALIKDNPGLTIRALAQKMGQESRKLYVPVQKLKRKGTIKTVGQRQKTRYFPMPLKK